MSTIRIHSVTDTGADIEVKVHGNRVDADYVKSLLIMEKNVRVRIDDTRPGMEGFVFLTARGSNVNVLTRPRVLELLTDQHIEFRLTPGEVKPSTPDA